MMTRFAYAIAATALFAGPALAQTFAPVPGRPIATPGTPAGAVVVRERDNTGGGSNLIVAPGATGAETYQSDSAAAGNASQPERAVPQGSGGSSR